MGKHPLIEMREQLSRQIKQLQAICDTRPENGAEITIAMRALQDARMRLGVALTIENGEDPWGSEV